MDLLVNHVGITVGDLERSIEFYTAFGGEVLIGSHFEGPHMDRGLGLEGVQLDVRMIRFKNLVLELLHYSAPPSSAYSSRNSDIGASHLAFEVDDIHKLHDDLKSRGLELFSEPVSIDDGPFRGGYWMYAKDPDGISLEFLQAGPEFSEVAG